MTSQDEGSVPIEIEAWLNSKASCLREAAHDLITHRRMPDEAGMDALADHCLQEAAKMLSQDFALLVPGAIAGTPGRAELRRNEAHGSGGLDVAALQEISRPRELVRATK